MVHCGQHLFITAGRICPVPKMLHFAFLFENVHEVTLARLTTAEASPEEEESGAYWFALVSSPGNALGWPI